MLSNLIAYIPTLNQRHLDWFRQHRHSRLFLISQGMAEELLPRLARNMAAVPTELMIPMLQATKKLFQVSEFLPEWGDPNLKSTHWGDWILPDEDVSHELTRKYPDLLRNAKFEMIWARWDMTAVHKAQLVIPDVVISSLEADTMRMQNLQKFAGRSPDWWRQIVAAAWKDGECLAVAVNTHLPNEYETYIFGDPRLNVDAGQLGKYVALHAERGVIARCARKGISLEGATLDVTTFPCEDCAREIAETGITHVLFRDGYSILNAQDTLRSRGIKIIQVVKTPTTA